MSAPKFTPGPWSVNPEFLIAAAPELYRALQMFVYPDQLEFQLTDSERRDAAQAALAKARGETQP